MQFKDIESISIIYGKKEKMKKFINYFWEFWERDGEDIQVLKINNKHSFFKDLKKFIWKGDQNKTNTNSYPKILHSKT